MLYLRLVLLMNFRITLLQWDKAKNTLTQNEEDGNFDSPTEHALNRLGINNLNAVNVQAGQILRFANNEFLDYAKDAALVLRWRQTFAIKWAETNLEDVADSVFIKSYSLTVMRKCNSYFYSLFMLFDSDLIAPAGQS